RIDDQELWVGRRHVPLRALDASTIGRAGNPWPWRVLSRRYLGANPIWTRDSVAVNGADEGGPYRVAVGTDRRDALVAVLRAATAHAHATALPPRSWHPDPWFPGHEGLGWWDGTAWTGHTWPPAPGVNGAGSAP